jgi:hypothetical protein
VKSFKDPFHFDGWRVGRHDEKQVYQPDQAIDIGGHAGTQKQGFVILEKMSGDHKSKA